jgi:hypothetical protein
LKVDEEPAECAEALNVLRGRGKHWWKRPGIPEAVPTTPDEAMIKFRALSNQSKFVYDEVKEPLDILAGETLLDAQAMFPTKKAWSEWSQCCKGCGGATEHANYTMRLAAWKRKHAKDTAETKATYAIASAIVDAAEERNAKADAPEPSAGASDPIERARAYLAEAAEASEAAE